MLLQKKGFSYVGMSFSASPQASLIILSTTPAIVIPACGAWIKVAGFGHVSTDPPGPIVIIISSQFLSSGLMGFLVPYAALSFGRGGSWIVVVPGVIASGQVLSLILRHSSRSSSFACSGGLASSKEQQAF